MLKTLIKLRIKGIFLRQTKTSKKKGRSLGRVILMAVLFGYVAIVFIGMFGALFFSIIEPLHAMNLDWLYFALMSLSIIMLCFIGSVFITHHEIYEAKDNELLLSMPIRNRDILLSRVFTILILDYIYELIIAIPAFAVYMYFIGMNIIQIILFVGVIITLPLFILALSCLFGWLLAHILVKVRMKNVITIVLYIAFMGLYFYVINSLEEYIGWLVLNGSSIAQAIEKGAFPIYHLGLAISQGNIMSFLIYAICAIVPFAIVIYLLSKNFIKLATTKPKMKKIVYKAKAMKTNSIKKALLIRELKHFTSNAMVMLNGAVGIIFCIIGAIALIIYSQDILMLLNEIPEIGNVLTPLLCLMGIAVNSMNMISASSISLEGNRLWIIKSMPIQAKDILQTKLFMHFILCVPAGLIFSMATVFVFRVSLINAIFVVLAPVLFTLFIDLLGLLLNLWKPKFDWVNETVCVKQSMPVMLTMFIAMGMAFVIAVVYVFIGTMLPIDINVYMYCVFILFIIVDVLLYYLLNTWGIKKFEQL